MRRLCCVLGGIILASGMLRAQSAPPADQTEVINSLMQQVKALEQRVAELESKQKTASVLPAATSSSAATAGLHAHEVVETPPQTVTPPMVEEHYPRIQIRGFGDVDFAAFDHRQPAFLGSDQPQNSGFYLGQFTLHITSPLSKKVAYFGELTWTPRSTGYLPEVERSIIRYDYNDYFKLSFGRYHTPINYWNTAFHHGLWLQTTVSRPEMIQFGTRFLPVHFLGLLAEGNLPSGKANLGYNVGLGNGRGSNIARAGDAGDLNGNRAWLVNVFARPAQLYGLQVGGSVYGDMITSTTGSGASAVTRNYHELITSAHIVYTKETPEVLAEFANVRHRLAGSSQEFNSQAFYVQVGYRLPIAEKKWKPYYRFEYIHTPKTEPVLGVAPLVGSVVGVRYDISDYAAFKSEYRHTSRNPADPIVNSVYLQTAFTF